MRAVPGRDRSPGRGDPPAGHRTDDRLPRGRAGAAHRRRRGDARRVDLRARADGRERGAVGDRDVRSVRRGGDGVSAVPVDMPAKLIDIEIDGEIVRVPEGATILDACRATGVDTPTMCYADNLTPINACRVCVVEVEGSRVLVPACSRAAEADMKVSTDTERVRHSRKLVMEFLGSSVDTSLASADWHRWQAEYAAQTRPVRGADGADAGGGARHARPGHHHDPDPARRRDRGAAGEGRQRPVRARLRASACSATSASRRAAPTRSTRSRSRSPVAGSTLASRRSTRCRWTRAPASIAGTASACVPRVR